MKTELTQKQRKLLNEINGYIDENKIAPTVRELSSLMGLKSESTVHSYLGRLKKKGYINWQTGMPRTIVVLKQA